ncbi:hypothetical protein EDB82DRAFT_494142 [Fusarium venenatum]|uniref:uncharacterized protein n=1 Tax=Fusarium venenatum TaxID=56646 RepID=UPI001DD2E20E|nr:hypothetical protein EDB82DRAFT_494142 [Fusarium venenatum]
MRSSFLHGCRKFKLEQGWEPLCKFLGKNVPNVEFPRVNESTWFDEKANILLKRGLKDGAIKAFSWVAAIACVWYWWYASHRVKWHITYYSSNYF